MNKIIVLIGLVFIVNDYCSQSYAPAAGQVGSTAIHKDSSIISNWAISCSVTRGYRQIDHPEYGYVNFGSEAEAIGQAEGNSLNIVSLGDGGSAVLTFNPPIKNGPGFDFAIFENGFQDNYMEFAFVEVSSNGIDYFRFPSFSETPLVPQISNASYGNCQYIHNLAGKYRQGYGTPFDLDDLDSVSALDLNSISFVRLIDVVGSVDLNYGTNDSQGNLINDPFPTNFDSGGFDLDGVAVINQGELSISKQQLTSGIYPNPFVDVIHFQGNKGAKINVYSVSGIEVFSGYLDNSNTAYLGHLNSGIYYMMINTGGKTSYSRIVKL